MSEMESCTLNAAIRRHSLTDPTDMPHVHKSARMSWHLNNENGKNNSCNGEVDDSSNHESEYLSSHDANSNSPALKNNNPEIGQNIHEDDIAETVQKMSKLRANSRDRDVSFLERSLSYSAVEHTNSSLRNDPRFHLRNGNENTATETEAATRSKGDNVQRINGNQSDETTSGCNDCSSSQNSAAVIKDEKNGLQLDITPITVNENDGKKSDTVHGKPPLPNTKTKRGSQGKQSWLLRLFESKLFNMSIAISYLFNSKEPGVQTYLGKYTLPVILFA